jgi:hypothetical protein
VGNAGVNDEEDKTISESSRVVRFNNYGTRENVKKTNDKLLCDILFSTFDLHSQGANPKDVVIGIPFPFKQESISNKAPRWYPKSNIWMVNPYLNAEMCRELKVTSNGSQHPLPSIGFTALWHMKDWKNEFYVCGFEWYFNGADKFQNWDLRNANYPTNWNHNYPKEIRWILENLYKKKNNFIFSKRCQHLLNLAQTITGWGI